MIRFVGVLLGVLYGYAISYLGQSVDLPIRAFHEVGGLILIARALKDVKRRTKIIILPAAVGFILITRAHVAFIDGRFDSRQKSPDNAVAALMDEEDRNQN